MAPTLTSNSFRLTTTPHSRIRTLNHHHNARRLTTTTTTVCATKSVGDDEQRQGQTGGSLGSFRFNLDDLKSLVPVVASPSSSGLSFGRERRKDPGTAFVAGATGQTGIRIAQTLLRQGFSVRAGVPDLASAQDLARLAVEYKIISNEESRRLNAVDSSFEDSESIAKAIGNASKVVVTIGPAENGPSGPVTTSDALTVIRAAQLANVGHVAIIYDGSSSTASSTNNVLDGIQSFFSNLFAKSQPLTIAEFLENVVETTDVSYTLIKTSLTEDFSPESSYNLVVSAEGNAAGGTNDYKVAKSQIASLVADVFSNTAVAENKVVEVFSDPSAPSKSTDELFSAIPEDGRRQAYAEAVAKAKAEEEAIKASEQAREAAEATKKLEEEVKKLEQEEARAATLAAEAQKKAEAAGVSLESLLDKAKGMSSGISKGMSSGMSWEKLSSQLKSAVETIEVVPKVQIATVRGQAKARSLPSVKAVVKDPPTKQEQKTPPPKPQPRPSKQKDVPKPQAKQTESKTETRRVFGGLFKQETIYIDDD